MGQQQDPALWARRSRSFGADAATYAEHRPGYAAEALAWLIAQAAPPDRTADILDLGAGTGALTAGLVATGARVRAVEPDPDMLAELRRRLPEVAAEQGSAEAIPLPDGSVDLVVAGQAWHWFDPARAVPEIARVLSPAGALVILANRPAPGVAWVEELNRVATTSASTPRRPEEPMAPVPGFTTPLSRSFAHGHRRTADSLTATFATYSNLLVVSPEEREETLGRIRALLADRVETAAGGFDYPLLTEVLLLRRERPISAA